MHCIRPWLYIGKYAETTANQMHYLASYDITAMLHLVSRVQHPGIQSLYLPVEDGVELPAEKIEQGVAFIRARKSEGCTVLVVCGAGISRSSTFALAALKEEEDLSLVDAYRAILEHHPDALPHPALWESLRTYYDDPLTFKQMWELLYGSL